MPDATLAPLRAEDGTVAILVAGLSLALLMVAGLVYDGGMVLSERRQAFALADSAARAGAQAIDIGVLRAEDRAAVDEHAAIEAALAFLTRAGSQGEVTVDGDSVRVVVRSEVDLAFLRAVGLETRTVTGRGEAVVLRGVTGAGG